LVLVCVVAAGCGGSGRESANVSSTVGTSNTTSAGVAGGGLFTASEPWTTDVSAAEKSDRSDAIIAALNDAGGWGNDNKLQTDFAITVFEANDSSPRLQVVANPDEYCYGGPDCDAVPAEMPVPQDATVEGSEDLSCDISGATESQGDCHLLVVDRGGKKLYETYQTNKEGDALTTGGLFVWDLDKEYPETLRGDQCTSADAAGFPIAALTPTADEVASGELAHAIRFILPNDRMKEGVYVRPATHAGGPESTDPNASPYGVRFRLKSDFDDSSYNDAEKTVIAAMKKYGMLLSDGGEIALTFADDRTSAAKWSDLDIDAQSFTDIAPEQFEVVELGDEVPLTYDCVRNP
jgi:serine/threonine-protein kinase